MPYNQKLYERLQQSLACIPNVEGKKMFSGIAFMVSGKMCISVGPDRIMCRIDPALHDEALKKEGTKTVQMRGRDYRGYVYVSADARITKKQLEYWVNLCLDFNKRAKASKKKANHKYEGESHKNLL
jgi:TfoX/Sxy family transcriptional regulator of competence genes